MYKCLSKPIILLLLIAVSLWCTQSVSAEKVYYPYPIVFVHGINSSDGMWVSMRNDLRQYFRYGITNQGIEEYKYPNQISELNYFIGCDYKDQNNGDIIDIAKYKLKLKIDDALSYYPPSIPESERKVIIVCHSMGGLVTRTLLTEVLTKVPSYKDKIHRVVFIDTPHLGSPYASALWLLNEIREDSEKNHNRNLMYHSYSAFSPFALFYADYIEYPLLYHEICNTQTNIDRLLAVLELTGPHPSGTAISQLRIPAFTYYKAIYQGFVLTLTIYKSYKGDETFLGQNNLDMPSGYKVIVGKNTSGLATKLWEVAKVFNLSEPFTFPTLAGEAQTLDNAVFNGDGIVTKSSQEAVTMNDVGKADYRVNGFHVGIADNSINEVLQAIDDKPVIEEVRVARLLGVNYYYLNGAKVHRPDKTYIIIKAKDYLLADIEFETNIPANDYYNNLNEYRDDPNKPYKPYFKFGKDFLKERTELIKDANDAEIPLRLQPGEFYLEFKEPLYMSGWIKLKNPAGKETECEIYTASDTAYVARSGVSLSSRPDMDNPDRWYPVPNYSDDRWMAYNSFLSMPESLSSGGLLILGAYVYGAGGYSNVPYYPIRFAEIGMEYLRFITFNLNITDKKIKSVKFAGYVNKELEGGGEDFIISVLRDTSNIWPVTLNSQADKLLFELNTLSYQDKDSFETAIEPSDLNLNGYNVWRCRSNIPIPVNAEDNIIPASIPNEGSIRNVAVIYQRSFYIGNPLLILIYE